MTGSFQEVIDSGDFRFPAHLSEGLRLLWQAHQYAQNVGHDPWDFAVEIDELRQSGMSKGDLRWLVCRGYAAHAREVPSKNKSPREFRPSDSLRFHKTSCFRLTPEGLQFAQEFSMQSHSTATDRNVTPPSEEPALPRWDGDRHQLLVGGEIVKEFKVPSPNQEAVLAALEEEGWPVRIDDPLPPISHIDAKRRLHDTIKSLNRNQKRHLICFLGDGTGEGVRWELMAARQAPHTDRLRSARTFANSPA